MKFEICSSQIIAKILLKQQSLNQIRHCLTDIIKSDIIFLLKSIKVF